MSNSIEELGKLLNSHMQRTSSAKIGISVELGSINGNGSLVVGSLNNAIPKGEYMVSFRLTLPTLLLNTKEVELRTEEALKTEEALEHAHTIKKHKHEVELPVQLRGLMPGDRVLVAWVGTEPVVIDIVVSS